MLKHFDIENMALPCSLSCVVPLEYSEKDYYLFIAHCIRSTVDWLEFAIIGRNYGFQIEFLADVQYVQAEIMS